MESYTTAKGGADSDYYEGNDMTLMLPKDTMAATASNRKYPPGFTFAKPTGFNPVPIVLLVLLTSPYIKSEESNIPILKNTGNGVLKKEYDDSYNSDFYKYKSVGMGHNILDLLSAIYPYIGQDAQDKINSIFGMSEIHSILKGILDNSYRTLELPSYGEAVLSNKEKITGLIRALQPFIPLENQTIVNRLLEFDDTMGKLSHRLNDFRQRDIDSMSPKDQYLIRIKEAMDIAKVILTPSHHHQIDNIMNIIRTIETIELAQIFNKPPQDKLHEKNPTYKDPSNLSAKTGGGYEKPQPNIENTVKALQPLLSPDQSKSLDFIVKMAQLMSQSEKDRPSAD